MTDYLFQEVPVYDRLGVNLMLARKVRIDVLDTVLDLTSPGLKQQGQPVPYVTTDELGRATFTNTQGFARLRGPKGFEQIVYSPQYLDSVKQAAVDAASSATSAANSAASSAASAALVGAPAGSAIDAYVGTGTSAAARRGGAVIVAADHGAAGDGTTDDYAALTSALTAIKAAGSFAKARTLLLAGNKTYAVSAPILLDAAGLTLAGDGSGVTTLKLTATLTNQSVVKITAANCRVENVTIDCNAKTAWSIWGVNANGIRMRDVTVMGTVQHGIYLNNCDDATLGHVRMTNCGTAAGSNPAGLYASECDGLVLDHCHATGSFQHGYYLLGGTASSLTMTGCTATGNGGVGISARTNRATITGCYSWGNAVQSFQLSYVIEPSTKGSISMVTGNIFGGTTATTANEVSLAMDSIVFTGNRVESAVATAGVVRFISCTGVTVTGNAVTSTIAGVAGAIRFDSCTDYLCASNKINGATGGSGVFIATASSNGKVADNKINTFANGVTLDASAHNDVHVTNNECLNCTTRPVTNSTTGTGVMVMGNSLPSAYEFPAPPRLPIYTTAGRPTPASAGTGGMYWDSTLGKPGISTGTAWKDFMTGAVI